MPKKKTHKEGNLYDKIFKENAEQLFLPLVEERLNIKIKTFQPLQEKMQTTIEREMDFFYEVTTEADDLFLLHLEFQTENDEEMIYRSAEYHGMAFRRKRLRIKHVVVFLGKGEVTMKTELTDREVFKGFEVINIHKMDTKLFLSSQIPEIILLSILSDIPKDTTEAVLRLVIQQLKKVCKQPNELSRYLKQLIILARLRKFEDTATKIVNTMPITYDIETDYLYLQGRKKGEADGVLKGIQKGKEQGKEEGKEVGEKQGKLKNSILATKNMLEKKFEVSLIAELLGVEQAFILKIQKELTKEVAIITRLKKQQKIKTIAKAVKVSEPLVAVIAEIQADKKKNKKHLK